MDLTLKADCLLLVARFLLYDLGTSPVNLFFFFENPCSR